MIVSVPYLILDQRLAQVQLIGVHQQRAMVVRIRLTQFSGSSRNLRANKNKTKRTK